MQKVFFITLFITVCFNLSAQKLESFYDKTSKKTGFKDATGKIIIPPKYDYVFSSNEGAFFTVELNKKRGFIDITGKEIIPVIYDHAADFTEGLACVKKK